MIAAFARVRSYACDDGGLLPPPFRGRGRSGIAAINRHDGIRICY